MNGGAYDGELTFPIKADEAILPGDWLVKDRTSGRFRKGLSGQDSGGFSVPPGSKVDHARGELVIPIRPTVVEGLP